MEALSRVEYSPEPRRLKLETSPVILRFNRVSRHPFECLFSFVVFFLVKVILERWPALRRGLIFLYKKYQKKLKSKNIRFFYKIIPKSIGSVC